MTAYRAQHGIQNTGPEFVVDLPPNSSVPASALVAVPDTFVTTGDLAAVAQLVGLMTEWKRSFILRSGRDLSFGDLRKRPSVMIGAFNNAWALELTKDLPFSFDGGTRIRSRDHVEKSWTAGTVGRDADDYAIISRLLTSKTGGVLISVAGIGQYGTQAAADSLLTLTGCVIF